MRKFWAILGTVLFFAVAPGTVAGYVPWLLSHWVLRDPFFGTQWSRAAGAVPRWLPRILPWRGPSPAA